MRADRIWFHVSLILLIGGLCPGCVGKGRDADSSPRANARPGEFWLASPDPNEGTIEYLDAKFGFRNLKFGSSVQSGMELAKEQDHELTKTYVFPGESLDAGGAKLAGIRYVYYSNRLISVIIETEGQRNSRALVEELQAAYGSTAREGAVVQTWPGELIVLSYAEQPRGDATTVIWSRAHMAPVVREQRARALAK